MVAAAKGGPDLSSNASLRLAVSKAKAKSPLLKALMTLKSLPHTPCPRSAAYFTARCRGGRYPQPRCDENSSLTVLSAA